MEIKPKHIFYFDEDELLDDFCDQVGCHCCDGTDMNGEPNGYGCDEGEKFQDDNWRLIVNAEDEKYMSKIRDEIENRRAEPRCEVDLHKAIKILGADEDVHRIILEIQENLHISILEVLEPLEKNTEWLKIK